MEESEKYVKDNWGNGGVNIVTNPEDVTFSPDSLLIDYLPVGGEFGSTPSYEAVEGHCVIQSKGTLAQSYTCQSRRWLMKRTRVSGNGQSTGVPYICRERGQPPYKADETDGQEES